MGVRPSGPPHRIILFPLGLYCRDCAERSLSRVALERENPGREGADHSLGRAPGAP